MSSGTFKILKVLKIEAFLDIVMVWVEKDDDMNNAFQIYFKIVCMCWHVLLLAPTDKFLPAGSASYIYSIFSEMFYFGISKKFYFGNYFRNYFGRLMSTQANFCSEPMCASFCCELPTYLRICNIHQITKKAQ